MTKVNPAIPLYALALAGLIGIIVLAGLGQPIPDILSTVMLAGLAGGAGVTVPVRTGDVPAVPPSSTVLPAPGPGTTITMSQDPNPTTIRRSP